MAGRSCAAKRIELGKGQGDEGNGEMTKQPWSKVWQEIVPGLGLPPDEVLVEFVNGERQIYGSSSIRRTDGMVRYTTRLPELVRTVDFWIDVNEGYETGLTTWSVGAPETIKSRCRLARITLTGEVGTGGLKAEWV